MLRTMTVLAACVLCQAAQAQTIYKCTVDGKVAYGDRPCADGASVELDVPSAPPLAPALQQSRREREALARIEKLKLAREEREEREAASARRAAASQYRKCASLRLRRKWADEDASRAAGRQVDTLKRKARRLAEQLAVECPA